MSADGADFDFKSVTRKEDAKKKERKRNRAIHATEHLPQRFQRICETHRSDKNAFARQPADARRPVLAHIFRIIESTAPAVTTDINSSFLRHAKCSFEKYNAALYPSRFTLSACETTWAKKVVPALKTYERSASRKWLGVPKRVLRLILSIKWLIELISNLGEINDIEIDICQVTIEIDKRNVFHL